jgi:sulfate permease, SulP family
MAIRVDENLYFANTKYLESYLRKAIADHPDVQHLVFICSAINVIDANALETLETLIEEFREVGIATYLTEVKGPVMDRLERVGFVEKIGRDRIFLSTHQAMVSLGCL